jgi:hypothetical protein
MYKMDFLRITHNILCITELRLQPAIEFFSTIPLTIFNNRFTHLSTAEFIKFRRFFLYTTLNIFSYYNITVKL